MIFLDVDGVLNSAQYRKQIYPNRQELSYIERNVDKQCLLNLKKILKETGAKIVVSSTWRKDKDYNKFKEYLAKEGIGILDETPDLGESGKNRGEEIRKWLTNYKEQVEKFIIIDDDIFHDFYELTTYQIKPNMFENRGIEEQHVQEAIERLGRIKQELERD